MKIAWMSNRFIQKMKNGLILIFLFVSLISCGQQKTFDPEKISNETNKIVLRIAEINEVMGGAVGYGGERPEQYDNFTSLRETASQQELEELTNHPNAVVRCYSFWALSYHSEADLFSIAVDHINDTTQVETLFGCLGGYEMVGDFFINIITPGYIDLKVQKMDSAQMHQLDSILIYTPNELYTTDQALNRIESTEAIYPRIRELVVEEQNQTALVKLASYQREEDIELILNNRQEDEKEESGYFYTYKAIAAFPHPRFFPLLEKNLYKTLDNKRYSGEWRMLYRAIASYKNEKANQLLKVPFKHVEDASIRKYHMDFMYEALLAYQAPIYTDLLWRLWKEEGKINSKIFELLALENKEQTLELTKATLSDHDKLPYVSVDRIQPGSEIKENTITLMLEFVLEQDSTFGIRIIAENLRTANVHQYPVFTDKVFEIKDPVFVEPLFERLKKESNAHIYLDIVTALLNYDDDQINERIVETRKKNKNLNKGWGSNSLDQMLQDLE